MKRYVLKSGCGNCMAQKITSLYHFEHVSFLGTGKKNKLINLQSGKSGQIL